MVVVKQRHCAQRKTIMIYSDDLIAQKGNFQCNHKTQQVVAVIK